MDLTKIISQDKFFEIVKKLAKNGNFFHHFLNQHDLDNSFGIENIRKKAITANFTAQIGYKQSGIDFKCEDFDRYFQICSKTKNHNGTEYFLFVFDPNGYGDTRVTLHIKRQSQIDDILELLDK